MIGQYQLYLLCDLIKSFERMIAQININLKTKKDTIYLFLCGKNKKFF